MPTFNLTPSEAPVSRPMIRHKQPSKIPLPRHHFLNWPRMGVKTRKFTPLNSSRARWPGRWIWDMYTSETAVHDKPHIITTNTAATQASLGCGQWCGWGTTGYEAILDALALGHSHTALPHLSCTSSALSLPLLTTDTHTYAKLSVLRGKQSGEGSTSRPRSLNHTSTWQEVAREHGRRSTRPPAQQTSPDTGFRPLPTAPTALSPPVHPADDTSGAAGLCKEVGGGHTYSNTAPYDLRRTHRHYRNMNAAQPLLSSVFWIDFPPSRGETLLFHAFWRLTHAGRLHRAGHDSGTHASNASVPSAVVFELWFGGKMVFF